jgi:plasmid stability protein
MPDILIRNLDEQVVKRLKQRAKQNHRSLQSEAKLLLERAAGSLILAQACEQANADEALEQDIDDWQAFEDNIAS